MIKPTKENFWKAFSNTTNGIFTEGKYGQSDKVEVKYKKWIISFDNYTFRNVTGDFYLEETHTRITTLIESWNDFRFEIYPQHFMSTISKWLGMQDIEIGIPAFDKAYIIKSNDATKISSLLHDDLLRTMIENMGKVHLQINDRKGIWEEQLPAGTLELSFHSKGERMEADKLNDIMQMFQRILDLL